MEACTGENGNGGGRYLLNPTQVQAATEPFHPRVEGLLEEHLLAY